MKSAATRKPPRPVVKQRQRWTKAQDAALGTMPDRQLAKKFGRSVLAVAARRHLKRISIRNGWKPDEDRLLGTQPDRQVARLLGRPIASVAFRRRQLGILRFDERQRSVIAEKIAAMSDRQIARLLRKSHRLVRARPAARNVGFSKWTVAEERLLGKWPDDRVARFLGRTRKAVEGRRLGLGIRWALRGRRWTDEEDQLLNPARVRGPSRKWTAALAAKLGRTFVAVSYRRRKIYGTQVKQRKWSRRELRMLGTIPDREFAAATGRHCGAVQAKRCSLRIPSYRARHKFKWTPARERLLGTQPDGILARRWKCSYKMVGVRRKALGVAAPIQRSWTPQEERLIGVLPDAEVARRIGRTRKAVMHRRLAIKGGIFKLQPAWRKWLPEHEALLGTAPDREIAARLKRSEKAIARRRYKKRIPAWHGSSPG